MFFYPNFDLRFLLLPFTNLLHSDANLSMKFVERKVYFMKKSLSFVLALLMALTLMMSFAGATEAAPAAKYVFLFIGDGMGGPQISATQYYLGTKANPESSIPVPADLSFTTFKNVGVMTTYDASSFCPDSASTATSMASGEKTLSGVINYDINKEKAFKLVSEYAKESGKKVGVISSVSVDHATPAAFYAKSTSRDFYYEIAVQGMTGTTLDLLAGGGFKSPKGKEKDKRDILEIAAENGFQLINTADGIRNLKKEDGERLLITLPDLAGGAAMQYEIDRQRMVGEGKDSVSLSEVVKSAVRVLDNDKGFFMMVEGGKIDWSCHANDAATSIYETMAFADSVQVALDFAKDHPEETLIVVTGDHETGGMTIGFATTAYDTHFNYIQNQNISYESFDKIVGTMRDNKVSFEDALKQIQASYGLRATADGVAEADKGLVLTEQDLKALQDAYNLSMQAKDQRVIGDQEKLLYGGYEPLTVTCSHILNNKAGLAYTSYAHTGLQLPVYAQGANADLFGGSYDNTNIFDKLMAAMKLTK